MIGCLFAAAMAWSLLAVRFREAAAAADPLFGPRFARQPVLALIVPVLGFAAFSAGALRFSPALYPLGLWVLAMPPAMILRAVWR